ncbi:MAG: hypothetical protein ACJAT2_000008 [Bacteriovoracaceae bacterium]|jgi:hypothetical protein
MESKIKILDAESQLLYEFSMDQVEAAYAKAQELEEMGIEVTLKRPSLPETLGNTLGMSKADQEKLRLEIEEEVESHNEKPTCGGCE